MITILYFASLRENLGRGAEQIALPTGTCDLKSLRALLRVRGAAWGQAMADGSRVRAAVNQDLAGDDAAIKDGDEIAFFPPVTGG